MELLAAVLAQPATAMNVREAAMRLLADLDEQLTPEAYQAAWRGGRSADLDVAVGEILA